MAGKIIADIIEAPYNRITLNVGNTVVATMNASGLYTSTGNLLITQANQIGTAALPAGSILQVVQSAVLESDLVIAGTDGEVTIRSVTINNVRANSSFLVMGNSTQTVHNNTEARLNSSIKVGSGTSYTVAGNFLYGHRNYVNSADMRVNLNIWRHIPSSQITAGTNIVYWLGSNGEAGSTTVTLSHQGRPTYMVVMEIAG